jgi:Holliday junction DNA helicase RuvA
LSVLSPEDLVKAISREDIHRIDAVPGVGTKLAERIVRELRDKIANLKFGSEAHPPPAQAAASENGVGTIADDAVSALVNLAYKPIQAQRAVDSVLAENATADLETIIRKSLAVLLAEK